MKMKKIAKALFLVSGIWLVFVLVCPSRPSARGRAIVNVIRNDVRQIQGRELTRPELESELSQLRLDWSLNRFQPEITFVSPSEWSVALVPEKRKTFVNLHSWSYRIFFLELSQMELRKI